MSDHCTENKSHWLYLSCLSQYTTIDETDGFSSGTSSIGNQSGLYLELSSSPLTLSTLKQLNKHLATQLKQQTEKHIQFIVLFSQCPGFAQNNKTDYQKELAQMAGLYRSQQEVFKASGGQLISVASQVIVGGTYLIHGLSADIKLSTSDTRFYGAKPPLDISKILQQPLSDEETLLLSDAVEKKLITTIVEQDCLKATLEKLIEKPD